MSILLKDILRFDELLKKYPNKRVKLRFNTNWYDEKMGWIDYNQRYLDGRDKFFDNNILSIWSKTKRRISDNDIIFQFIEVKPHIWLLIDVSYIKSAEGDFAKAKRLDEYEKYFGKLFIKWTNLPQQFFYVKKDIINSIEIHKIAEKHYLETEEEFNGYESVCKKYKQLKQIIDQKTWKEALSRVYGVYVITDTKNGKQYVGSAYGENGIYGRWKTYLESGYDKDEKENGEYPNKELKKLVNAKEKGLKYIQENFQYAILEIFPMNELGKEKALNRETYWKTVLKTKEHGYNDN